MKYAYEFKSEICASNECITIHNVSMFNSFSSCYNDIIMNDIMTDKMSA